MLYGITNGVIEGSFSFMYFWHINVTGNQFRNVIGNLLGTSVLFGMLMKFYPGKTGHLFWHVHGTEKKPRAT